MKSNLALLADRIRALRERLKKSQAEFACVVGVEQATVSRWERAKVYPEPESIERMAELAKVSRLEFEYGARAFGGGEKDEKKPDGKRVLISGETAAGVWVEQAAIDEPTEVLTGFMPDHRYAGLRQFALRVRGSSMDKLRIFDGDIVICVDWGDLGKDFEDGDIVVVERARMGGHIRETTLKQIAITGSSVALWPRSSDPRFQEPVNLSESGEEEDTTVSVTGLVIAKTTVF